MTCLYLANKPVEKHQGHYLFGSLYSVQSLAYLENVTTNHENAVLFLEHHAMKKKEPIKVKYSTALAES